MKIFRVMKLLLEDRKLPELDPLDAEPEELPPKLEPPRGAPDPDVSPESECALRPI